MAKFRTAKTRIRAVSRSGTVFQWPHTGVYCLSDDAGEAEPGGMPWAVYLTRMAEINA